METERKTWVIGHKNPDTDSICSAIAYAYFKNKTDSGVFEAKRAGSINGETKYVLEYFKAPVPDYVTDVGAQVKDIEYRHTPGVNEHISLKKAWELMKADQISTLPIVTPHGKLMGVVVTGDIATSYMDIYDNEVLSRAMTPYMNILDTLDGTLLVGDEHDAIMEGKVVVATNSLEVLEEEDFIQAGDLVILGNRYEIQNFALDVPVSCMIVCSGTKVSEKIQTKAQEKGVVIITTPYDTFTVSRLINQSIPIEFFMSYRDLSTFNLEDYVDDVSEVMSQKRHRYFPILDDEGRYAGMLSRRNLLNMTKKKIILVDHNEAGQAVDGITGAEILEIIDHHRLGATETINPIFIRAQPLGCTSTIIYLMFQEKGLEIPSKIAGLMCSAILSDTLLYRSPTCTPVDESAAEALARIAGIKTEEHAKNMFRAGSNFGSMSPEAIFYQDFKTFFAAERDFGVGQIIAMSQEELDEVKERLIPYLEKVIVEKKLGMVYLMLTNVLEESTDLIYAGEEALHFAERAFHVKQEPDENSLFLKGVVSRKKQFLPAIIEAIQAHEQEGSIVD